MSKYCAGELNGFRLACLFTAGMLSLVVFVLFCVKVVTPELQEHFSPKVRTITTTQWTPNMFDEVNDAIEAGWVVQSLGNDSCGNICVYLNQ